MQRKRMQRKGQAAVETLPYSCIFLPATNLISVGGAVKSPHKHRILNYLKQYEKNLTFWVKAHQKNVIQST